MDAFDADVLIYATTADHELGRRVRALFPVEPVADAGVAGIGSVLLLPEVLSRPLREQSSDELTDLGALLSRLELRPTDQATAQLATALAASYRLRAADAVHLATGPEHNRADFPKSIIEIDIRYPDDLPDPGSR